MKNTQSKVPQLRFPEFGENYCTGLVSSFSEINPKSSELPERFYYIDLGSVKEGEIKSFNLIDKCDSPSRAQRLLKHGDVLFQTVRPYQKNNYQFKMNEKNYVASTGYAQVRPYESTEYHYQLFLSPSFQRKVSVRCTGTSYPAINSSDFGNIPVDIPKEPRERDNIATFLSTADKKIRLLKQKHEQLRQYKKGIMQQLFSQQLRFKDDNGQDFPDWKLECLGDYITVRKGEVVTEEMPLHSLTIENGIEPKSARYVRDFLVNNISEAYKVVLPGDFAMNPMNLRFGAIARHSGDGKVLLSKYYDVFYFNDVLDHDFMERYLKSHNMIGFYNKMATGTLEEKKRVHFSDFVKFRKLIPCYLEQKKIAGFLKSIDQKINLAQQQIEQTQTYKQGLLQKMFV